MIIQHEKKKLSRRLIVQFSWRESPVQERNDFECSNFEGQAYFTSQSRWLRLMQTQDDYSQCKFSFNSSLTKGHEMSRSPWDLRYLSSLADVGATSSSEQTRRHPPWRLLTGMTWKEFGSFNINDAQPKSMQHILSLGSPPYGLERDRCLSSVCLLLTDSTRVAKYPRHRRIDDARMEWRLDRVELTVDDLDECRHARNWRRRINVLTTLIAESRRTDDECTIYCCVFHDDVDSISKSVELPLRRRLRPAMRDDRQTQTGTWTQALRHETTVRLEPASTASSDHSGGLLTTALYRTKPVKPILPLTMTNPCPHVDNQETRNLTVHRWALPFRRIKFHRLHNCSYYSNYFQSNSRNLKFLGCEREYYTHIYIYVYLVPFNKCDVSTRYIW